MKALLGSNIFVRQLLEILETKEKWFKVYQYLQTEAVVVDQ